jgi:hypothetical protein
MSFTVDEIKQDVPSGFWAHTSFPHGITFKHTFQSSDITKGLPNNKRGVKIADLLRADGFRLHGGQGGSFVIQFTIKGQPKDHAETPVQDTQGILFAPTQLFLRLARNFSYIKLEKSFIFHLTLASLIQYYVNARPKSTT